MPFLSGFLNPINIQPAFLVPLFVDRAGSNRVLIQKISPNDTVDLFIEFDVEPQYPLDESNIELRPGQLAIWGFVHQNDEILWGNSAELAKQLIALLEQGAFSKTPLLESEVAIFCDRKKLYYNALKRAFRLLGKHSTLAAELWRDAVILLPAAREEIAANLPPDVLARDRGLRQVRVQGNAKQLSLFLPPELYQHWPASATEHLNRTKEMARAFGLSRLLAIKSAPPSLPPTERVIAKDEPFAAIIALSGTGAMVARNAPSDPRHVRFVFHPQRRKVAADPTSPPLFAFHVLNSTYGQVEVALAATGRWTKETVKIAIVMRPVGFGTPRQSRPNLLQLYRLFDAFEYVFIIANHLLQKPGGFAPTLNASHRGISFARAAIDGLMQLVWTQNGPKTAEQFRSRFPSQNYCLVGRTSLRSGEWISADTMNRTLGTMLHPSLPLSKAKRFIALAPDPNFSSDEVHRALQLYTGLDGERIASIAIPKARSINRIFSFAFSIEPEEVSASNFFSFCLRLLESLGWVFDHSRIARIALTSYPVENMALAFVLRVDEIAEAVETVRMRYPGSAKVCVVTNFTPPQRLIRAFRDWSVTIVHYSRLNELASS